MIRQSFSTTVKHANQMQVNSYVLYICMCEHEHVKAHVNTHIDFRQEGEMV